MKRIAKNKAGFSLVELIMVVAIIVILAGVMALNIVGYIQRAKRASSEEIASRSSAIGLVQSYSEHLDGLGFNRGMEHEED